MRKLDKETTGRIDLLVNLPSRAMAREMAHELNQPLQAIRGYAQELTNTGIKNPMLDEIVDQAERAAAIISYVRGSLTHHTSPSTMTGQGYEYLTDASGTVLAKFYNGQMLVTALPSGNSEVTRSAA